MTTDTAAKKDTQKLQRAIVDGLEDVKAQDIQVFDTEHLSPLFERVIVASGTSNRQTKALAASVRDAVREAGFPKPRIEGETNGEWIIVDCAQAVVHIMQPSFRTYYHLEELWGEKPVRLKFGAVKPVLKAVVKAAPVKAGAARKGAGKAAPAKAVTAPPAPAKAATARPATAKAISARPATAKPMSARPATAKAISARPATAKAATARAPAAKSAPARAPATRTAAAPARRAAAPAKPVAAVAKARKPAARTATPSPAKKAPARQR